MKSALAGSLCAVLGVLCVVASLFLSYNEQAPLRSCSEDITGIITNMQDSPPFKAGDQYLTRQWPVVSYTVNGYNYEIVWEMKGDSYSFITGQEVALRYNPLDPSECYVVDSAPEQSIVVYIVGGLGALLLLLGAFLIVRRFTGFS